MGYGIWDDKHAGWDSNAGPAFPKSGALTTAPQARLLLLLLRYLRFCLLYRAWQHARLRDVVLSGRLVQRVGVAFAWDLHDRQARPSSFRVGPCTAASSAWRSCCLVFVRWVVLSELEQSEAELQRSTTEAQSGVVVR